MMAPTFDEEEIQWGREAFRSRELTLHEIAAESEKPVGYWEAHLKDLIETLGRSHSPAVQTHRKYQRKPHYLTDSIPKHRKHNPHARAPTAEVLRELAEGVSQSDLARKYSVSRQRIGQIKHRGY